MIPTDGGEGRGSGVVLAVGRSKERRVSRKLPQAGVADDVTLRQFVPDEQDHLSRQSEQALPTGFETRQEAA